MDQGQGFESLSEQLKNIESVVKDNNTLLQSIQRRAKLSILVSSIKWLVIIGLSFGSLYFLQPYVEMIMSTYKSIGSDGLSGWNNMLTK